MDAHSMVNNAHQFQCQSKVNTSVSDTQVGGITIFLNLACCDYVHRYGSVFSCGIAVPRSIVGRYGNLSLLSKDELNCIVNYLATY